MHPLLLFCVILLEGFVTIAVEILTIRQLTPFVGNTVVAISLIIGVFLLFLALGYRRGGQYLGDYRAVLIGNFTLAALWLGIGLSYYFTASFFYYSHHWFTSNLLLNLTAYLLLIVAPLVYILGQTVPITANMFREQASVGQISGRVLFWSTLGSFSGAVITSLILLTWVGVAWSIVINFCLLALLILLLVDTWRVHWWRLIVLSVGLLVIYQLNVEVNRQVFIHENHYANYQLATDVEIEPGRVGNALVINQSVSSFLGNDGRPAPYIILIQKFLFDDLQLRDKRILVIGAGGFSLTQSSRYGNQWTYVDIDPAVETITREYFNPQLQEDFIAADARQYLRDNDTPFDVIINDAYSNNIMIPDYLLTHHYFQDLSAQLTDDGIAVFNFILHPLYADRYSRRVDNTVRSVFQHCAVVPLRYVAEYANVLYFCHKAPYNIKEQVYTDDLNPASLDFFNGIAEHWR
jgi:predicted membrane-bound spermidine synthase